MTQTSEWVSPGHPDKLADAISSRILDYCLERDPETRFAVECQIKGNRVALGGEVTSKAFLDGHALAFLARDAVERIGYTQDYHGLWGLGNTISPRDLYVMADIVQQSPDIAQGVDAGGWGDQGIFWGMATPEREFGYLPRDYYCARALGQHLYALSLQRGLPIGLDIKTQVETCDDIVRQVIVAAPCATDSATGLLRDEITAFVADWRTAPDFEIVVNGTGRYVRHASQGDCGTTGRKLAVDFYGGNCRIGGGSPWTKDPSKADLTLNLLARKLALEYVLSHRECHRAVYVALSCCIGRDEVRVAFFDERHIPIQTEHQSIFVPARAVAAELDLFSPNYFALCQSGLFSEVDRAVADVKPFDPSQPVFPSGR